MSKTKTFLIVAGLLSLGVSSCNKDEDIIADNSGDGTSGNYEFTVLEYTPAPGQFINEPASGFTGITTEAEAVRYAQDRLAEGNFVSLGGWGGYIVVRSARPILNSGGYDFAIAGNAFDTSNEPGIVWVMQDANGNGLPDDQWYELKGSYYGKEGYERDYWVTYYKPSSANSDVEWRDSNGDTGYVKWNTFHKQSSYYPAWITASSYTLYGSRLPQQAVENPETGVWSNEPFKWGYTDNNGEDSAIITEDGKTVQKNYFLISDAVDAQGNPVSLESIDFIKVQTAVNGSITVTGENSTEVCGFYRL